MLFFFALGTFQIFFQNHETDPNISDIKFLWNIGRAICIACTFHLRWAQLPRQKKGNAW